MLDLARDIIGSQPILTAFLAIGLGYLVGQISIAGFSLGVGAVLFVGLAIGAFAPKAQIIGPIGSETTSNASPADTTVSAVGTKFCPPLRIMVTWTSLNTPPDRSSSFRPEKPSPIEISPMWKRCAFTGNLGFTMRVMK